MVRIPAEGESQWHERVLDTALRRGDLTEVAAALLKLQPSLGRTAVDVEYVVSAPTHMELPTAFVQRLIWMIDPDGPTAYRLIAKRRPGRRPRRDPWDPRSVTSDVGIFTEMYDLYQKNKNMKIVIHELKLKHKISRTTLYEIWENFKELRESWDDQGE